MSERVKFDLGPLVELLADRVVSKLAADRGHDAADTRRRLLTIEQAGQYIGRTKIGVQHLVKTGVFPVVRSDRRVFIDVRDLDRWIEQSKKQV